MVTYADLLAYSQVIIGVVTTVLLAATLVIAIFNIKK